MRLKIGVISDTHIPVNGEELPGKLLEALAGCDLILHAGDLIDLRILESLKKVAKVEAVCGNMDPYETQNALEQKKILELGEKKICLMHGYGNPANLVDILKEEFFAEKPNIIVFGHSHVPMNEYIEGVLFFNPGSATDKVYAPYRSYGIIEIEDGDIIAKIHKL